MSSTPKAVRRNEGYCTCPEEDQLNFIDNHRFDDGTCRKGYWHAAKCRVCRGSLFEMGLLLGCPCEAPRWFRHPGMRQPGHWDKEACRYVPARSGAAVKPSIARRR